MSKKPQNLLTRAMMKQKWQDPAYREKRAKAHAEYLRGRWRDPENHERHRRIMTERMREILRDPVVRQQYRENLGKARWARGPHSAERRVIQSEKMKQWWAGLSPEDKARMLAKRSATRRTKKGRE